MKNSALIWKISTLVLGVTSVLFCALWIYKLVPAEKSTEWITAITAVMALIAAGVAAGAALEQLGMLRRDAAARARDERIRQARKVFFVESPPRKLDGRIEPGEFVLYNNSSEPIQKVNFYLQTPDSVHTIYSSITLPPTDADGYPADEIAGVITSQVSPWQMKEVTTRSGNKAFWGFHPYELFMIFEDSSGRQWIRTEKNGLIEVEGDVKEHIPRQPLDIIHSS